MQNTLGWAPAHRLRAFVQRCLALALVLAVGLGCRGTSEPEARVLRTPFGPEVYALRAVAGKALPAIGVEHEHLRLTILADTLWLRPDGTGERRTVEHTVSSNALPPGEATHDHRTSLTYRVDGDRFTAEFPCRDMAMCVAPPHLVGTLVDGALTLDYALYLRTPLSYSRVR